ncbi:hypothetical protein JKP88DRAFT_245094 [Tribonema minus]|uniref:Uncharacterized protein n=1 Tax=Tribonema minus TaxID=303371 RepID=A0A835YYI1_9STRA|nr:hypothetical protein JKP88DRAFT_245094 [Tribonema minus]
MGNAGSGRQGAQQGGMQTRAVPCEKKIEETHPLIKVIDNACKDAQRLFCCFCPRDDALPGRYIVGFSRKLLHSNVKLDSNFDPEEYQRMLDAQQMINVRPNPQRCVANRPGGIGRCKWAYVVARQRGLQLYVPRPLAVRTPVRRGRVIDADDDGLVEIDSPGVQAVEQQLTARGAVCDARPRAASVRAPLFFVCDRGGFDSFAFHMQQRQQQLRSWQRTGAAPALSTADGVAVLHQPCSRTHNALNLTDSSCPRLLSHEGFIPSDVCNITCADYQGS